MPMLLQHTAACYCCAISNDSRWIVSGDHSGQVFLWDVQTLRMVYSRLEHSDAVWKVAISPDNTTFVSASLDFTLKVWNLQQGAVTATLTGHPKWIFGLDVSWETHLLVSASADGTIKLWDTQNWECQRTLTSPQQIMALAVDVQTTRMAEGGVDRVINIWDYATGEIVHSLSGHDRAINSIRISNGRLVSGSDDRTVKVWDLARGCLLATLHGHRTHVSVVASIPKFNQIVSASADGVMNEWVAGRIVYSRDAHAVQVCDIKASQDGKLIVTASGDETVKIWDSYGAITQVVMLLGFFVSDSSVHFAEAAPSFLSRHTPQNR
eukprot:c15466_g1_i3.p1 GENE.c15466_g1_i3~~c15466_g1_i3.p1  ORF type:complete len:323 (+),score=57.22 c15466_g1_i3:31-999(+)